MTLGINIWITIVSFNANPIPISHLLIFFPAGSCQRFSSRFLIISKIFFSNINIIFFFLRFFFLCPFSDTITDRFYFFSILFRRISIRRMTLSLNKGNCLCLMKMIVFIWRHTGKKKRRVTRLVMMSKKRESKKRNFKEKNIIF